MAFGISTATRYVASTINQVVRSMESLTDYPVRYTVGFKYMLAFSISTATRYVVSTKNHLVRSIKSLTDYAVRCTVGF